MLVGVFAFLLTAAFSWVPSVWYDEAATVISATRTWPELWRMIGTVDVVHAAYYAGMHLWFDLVGYSPLTLRLPSAVATGLAAGGTVVLGRTLGGRRLGLLAGIAFCLFPRVTWMGAEGRSFALGTALAVALTLVFLAAWTRGSRSVAVRARWWAGYAVLAVVATLVFSFLAFLVVAHGVTALWALASVRRVRGPAAGDGAADAAARADRLPAVRGVYGWAAAALVSGLACVPFAIVAANQSGQVDWIDPVSARTWHAMFVTQLFPRAYGFATVAWALIVLGLIVLVLAAYGRWRRPAPAHGALRSGPAPLPSLASVAVPFLIVPTVLLITVSVLIDPLFSPRYLTFTAPGAALLLAVGIDALGGDGPDGKTTGPDGRSAQHHRRTVSAGVALVALAALSAPQIVAQRQPEAKQESSWAEVAELIATERAEEPPGTVEAVIFGPVRRHPGASSRVIQYSYPDAFEGLQDFALKTPAVRTGALWEETYRVRDSLDRLDPDTDVVWLVTSNRQDWRPGITERLAPLGFTLDEEWNPTNVNVLRFRR